MRTEHGPAAPSHLSPQPMSLHLILTPNTFSQCYTGQLHGLLGPTETLIKHIMLVSGFSLCAGSKALVRSQGPLLNMSFLSRYDKTAPWDPGERREVALCVLLMQFLSMHIHPGMRLSAEEAEEEGETEPLKKQITMPHILYYFLPCFFNQSKLRALVIP